MISLGSQLTKNIGANYTHNEDSYQNVHKLMQMLAKYEKLNLDNQKQVTLFLGKTGWGKSTTINYLDGVSLKINEDGHLALKNSA